MFSCEICDKKQLWKTASKYWKLMVLLWKPNTNAWLTHYSPVLLFYTSWKYQKTERFSVVFMRYRKAPPGCNGLILSGNDFTVLFKNGLSRLINKFHFFLKFVRIGHYNIRIIKSYGTVTLLQLVRYWRPFIVFVTFSDQIWSFYVFRWSNKKWWNIFLYRHRT